MLRAPGGTCTAPVQTSACEGGALAQPCCAAQVTADRQKWRRFGGANLSADKDSGITARSLDEIPFERVRPNKQTQEEKKAATIQQALQTSNNQAIVGRWTPKGCRVQGVKGTRAPAAWAAQPAGAADARSPGPPRQVVPLGCRAQARTCNKARQPLSCRTF